MSTQTARSSSGPSFVPTSRLFWGLVVLFNVAIVAVSLGVMLIAFGVDETLGLQVLLGGLVLSVYGVYRYRDARNQAADIVGGDEDND